MKTQIIIGLLLITGFVVISFLSPFGEVPEESSPKEVALDERIGPTDTVEAADSLLAWKVGMMVYQGRPFSGHIIERHDNNRIKTKTEYVNGKRHGVVMKWYPDGIVMDVRYYTRGAKVGVHTGWWPNGEIKFSYAFKEGLYHGGFREWYDTGQPSKAFYYQDGRETGAQKGWRENGKLYINLVYKNGRRYGIAKQKPCFSIVDGKRKGVGDERFGVFDRTTADDRWVSAERSTDR